MLDSLASYTANPTIPSIRLCDPHQGRRSSMHIILEPSIFYTAGSYILVTGSITCSYYAFHMLTKVDPLFWFVLEQLAHISYK
jgi:hypothetical protein